MKKFYFIQKLISIVPIFSTVLIFAFTIVELIRQHSSKSGWIKFALITAFTPIVAVSVNLYLLSGMYPLINIVCTVLILALGNVLCVYLQEKCAKAHGDIASTKLPPYFLPVFLGWLGFFVTISAITAIVSSLFPSIEYPDTNGVEDTGLSIIGTSEIMAERPTYSARFISESRTGNTTNIDGFILEEYDCDNCSITCKRLDGVMNILATDTDEDGFVLKLESLINSGNMELYVLIDGVICYSIPAGENAEIYLDDVKDKLVIVRAAAESADVSIKVSRIFE